MTALTNTAPLNVRAAAPARLISMTKWVLLLGSMAALGAMTTDMYLPSLPEVARELGTGMPQVQFTIAGTLIGGAAGQLFIGPMSDRFGRRDRKSTRLNSSHVAISYAVFCLKKKTRGRERPEQAQRARRPTA